MTELIEYYRMLEKNREFFEKAERIASDIKSKAREIFRDCEVYIVGSFARKEHNLSSDLDILIVSDEIPEKLDLEFYCKLVKNLSTDERVNIHPINRRKFKEIEKIYSPKIPV